MSDATGLTEPPNRLTRHKQKTRARLIRAALSVMARKGADAATINDITEAADVGFGSFYNTQVGTTGWSPVEQQDGSCADRSPHGGGRPSRAEPRMIWRFPSRRRSRRRADRRREDDADRPQ